MNPRDPSPSAKRSPSVFAQRRTVPRYMMVATTDLSDASKTVRLTCRVTEISRKGCYIDTMNAMPVGTLLNLRISRDQGDFITRAKVVYAHQNMGMGLTFLDPPEDQLRILDSWLEELASSEPG
jgi:PilZ domain